MGPTEIDSKFDQDNSFLPWLIPDPAQRAGVVKAGNASVTSGAVVYYRIGRSFGANVNPPPDFDKLANVVKHMAMHYNQGWANGFHYHIAYWESGMNRRFSSLALLNSFTRCMKERLGP